MPHRKTQKDIERLRSLSQGKVLARSPFKSHYLAKTEGPIAVPPEDLSMFDKFRKSRIFAWFASWFSGIGSTMGARHDFLDPRISDPNNKGIYPMESDCRIAVAGDWGTGAYESEAVARSLGNDDSGNKNIPDFSLHIGDVYYIGSQDEMNHNCALDPAHNVVSWPRGKKGSFALLGNHEMFSRGFPYFDTFLPHLGIVENGKYSKQKSSLFCLENDDWLIVGLDTGYNSVKWFVKYGLRDENIEWLSECAFTDARKHKGIILTSHHQYFSRFPSEEDYPRFAQQLAGINGFLSGREVLWLWGHEHRFAGYELSSGMDLTVHGRCIGHSGMPIEIKDPDMTKTGVPPIAFYDKRENPYYTEELTGMNGYCMLDFHGSELALSYYDGLWVPKDGSFPL